jgi:hypothetical protein
MKKYKEVQQAENMYYLIMNFKELKQRVWGDFRVKIEGKVSFYFWLNVSAIINNNKLKLLSDERQRDKPHLPNLHFEQFTEYDENYVEDKSKLKLLRYNDMLAKAIESQEQKEEEKEDGDEADIRLKIQDLVT